MPRNVPNYPRDHSVKLSGPTLLHLSHGQLSAVVGRRGGETPSFVEIYQTYDPRFPFIDARGCWVPAGGTDDLIFREAGYERLELSFEVVHSRLKDFPVTLDSTYVHIQTFVMMKEFLLFASLRDAPRQQERSAGGRTFATPPTSIAFTPKASRDCFIWTHYRTRLLAIKREAAPESISAWPQGTCSQGLLGCMQTCLVG